MHVASTSIGLADAERGDVLRRVHDHFVAPAIQTLEKLLDPKQHQFKMDEAILSELFKHLTLTRCMYLVQPVDEK